MSCAVERDCLINFDRAVKKLEEFSRQLKASAEVIEKQKQVIAALEEREVTRKKEIEALRQALVEEETAKLLALRRATNAEARVTELEQEVAKQKKRGKWKFIGGIVLGAAAAAAAAAGGATN